MCQFEDRESFINNNMGLVYSCAKRFVHKGIEFDDLIGAGSVGLCKAYDGFDVNRGVKFSTYAVPVILGEMRRLFRDDGTVKVSRSIKELAIKVNRETENYNKKYNREPSITEISHILGVEVAQVAMAINASIPVLSLTQEDDEKEGAEIDIALDSPEEAISEKLALQQALSQLKVDDRNIILMRFFHDMTQQQTADRLGMTQVQISRREKNILSQLRLKLTG